MKFLTKLLFCKWVVIFRLFTMFRAHIIIGNIKSSITGIYHGITKREMPLFLNEKENRFNHRNVGKTVMDKIKKYLQKSFPISHRLIVYILNISAPHFS